jgi:hypothetical protein
MNDDVGNNLVNVDVMFFTKLNERWIGGDKQFVFVLQKQIPIFVARHDVLEHHVCRRSAFHLHLLNDSTHLIGVSNHLAGVRV